MVECGGMKKAGTQIFGPDGRERKNYAGPASHNIIVRKGAKEGGVSGAEHSNMGLAFRSPNFRRPGCAPPDMSRAWHYVAEDTRFEKDKCLWAGYFGLQVGDKGKGGVGRHLCLFPREKKTLGAWGAPFPATTFYLMYGVEYNTPENGRRLQEYAEFCLRLAGRDLHSQAERQSMYRAMDMMFDAMSEGFGETFGSVAHGIALLEEHICHQFGLSGGVVDSHRLIDKQGRDAGMYEERLNGQTSGIRVAPRAET